MKLKLDEANSLLLLRVLYGVGLFVLLSRVLPEFARLTPLNLIVSAFLVLRFDPKRSTRLWLLLGAIGILGFTLEVVGVHSSFPFGSYQYGDTLGWKIGGVPLILALNWVLLTYCAASFTEHWIPVSRPALQAAASASLLVLLDVFLEPVAVQLYFWYWKEVGVGGILVAPWQNYVAWWVLSWCFSFMLHYWGGKRDNHLAWQLFSLLFIFFAILAAAGYLLNAGF